MDTRESFSSSNSIWNWNDTKWEIGYRENTTENWRETKRFCSKVSRGGGGANKSGWIMKLGKLDSLQIRFGIQIEEKRARNWWQALVGHSRRPAGDRPIGRLARPDASNYIRKHSHRGIRMHSKADNFKRQTKWVQSGENKKNWSQEREEQKKRKNLSANAWVLRPFINRP